MNQAGFCIFMDIDAESLIYRLTHARTERPLIKGKSPEELREFIDALMLKRRPFYEKAQYILKGKEISAEQIIEIVDEKKLNSGHD
jgi:shikimate kinase